MQSMSWSAVLLSHWGNSVVRVAGSS